jgi:hypothetical protein
MDMRMKTIFQTILILALAAIVGLSLGKLAQAKGVPADQPTVHGSAISGS